MPGLLCGCTTGISGPASTPRDPKNDTLDPLLDLSLPEEQELPALTVGTTTAVPVGENEMEVEGEDTGMKVSLLSMDSKVHVSYVEMLVAVGVDGCKRIREVVDGIIKGADRVVLG